MQTRLQSLIESWTNVLIGFGVAWVANMLVLRHFENPGSPASAFWIAVIFTFISMIRSYALRRVFNRVHR